ncbi:MULTISPECIES: hypothetical protein [unclassified Rickettsia]|uniref:hypothetical protein n=1 Tax=unclassified Rickettsia TaxID=114295 RepID=UPI0031333D35
MPNKIIPTPFEAIQNNDMKALKAWLESGGNPNAEDENGNSLVELLATRHNLEGIKILSPYNPDMSVKRNSVGEFSKNIVSLVSTGSEELRNFIDLEVAFYEEDFSLTEIAFGELFLHSKPVYRQNKNFHSQYNQIIDFIKYKLTTLNINSIKNNLNALEEHMKKLYYLHEFVNDKQYFTNKLVTMFLEKKINEYTNTQYVTDESFVDFENNYYEDEKIKLLGYNIH